MTAIHLSRGLLAGSWEALASSRSAEMASLPLEALHEIGVRIAIDSDRSRHLLVPTGIPTRPWNQIDSPLRESVRSLAFAGAHGKRYLDVRCSNATLFDLFDELIIGVLGRARSAGDVGAAVDSSLSEWRAMFRAAALVGFGRNQRFGLFAELLTLQASAESLGASAAKYWTGPSGLSHDFELPGGCIEVKGASTSSNSVTIHGLEQLAAHDERPLALLVYRLGESEEGSTIRQLISDIESRCGSGALDNALAAVGFTKTTPDERLVVVDAFVVEVDDRIPRLEAAVGGITRAEYDVSIDALRAIMKPSAPSAAIAKAAR
ncbi:PD-(D/E)XK motif protein [Leifsonia sp. F6_8S_P_1B]|uniref:PD-(D/E)XK motif protein n=1 Tax=Leifsonia williamsii TaxID=3035919 RepID=A0ABT8KAX5_9MICO|nr:PD-(D/E)XK motif protein [Leifsonia williamsii]MDN4614576.1 PD-(D/E)XK motif protein [Leifsonia williamsii]